MDAEHLEFEDNSFDAVLALYVASVVPNPARFAAEMRRVCIPGGTIVLVNHFTSENWALRWMEKRLAHLARHIGFHADFPLDTFLRDSGLVGPRDPAEQSVRLLAAVALHQRKARLDPGLNGTVGWVERSETRHR